MNWKRISEVLLYIFLQSARLHRLLHNFIHNSKVLLAPALPQLLRAAANIYFFEKMPQIAFVMVHLPQKIAAPFNHEEQYALFLNRHTVHSAIA